MNLINFLDVNNTICSVLADVFKIFGYIYFFIKVLTPIFLLIFGMITMVNAIVARDESAIQKAWKKLTNSFIAAVSVFLVASLVGLLMTLLSSDEYKPCAQCVNNPFSCSGDIDTNSNTNKDIINKGGSNNNNNKTNTNRNETK